MEDGLTVDIQTEAGVGTVLENLKTQFPDNSISTALNSLLVMDVARSFQLHITLALHSHHLCQVPNRSCSGFSRIQNRRRRYELQHSVRWEEFFFPKAPLHLATSTCEGIVHSYDSGECVHWNLQVSQNSCPNTNIWYKTRPCIAKKARHTPCRSDPRDASYPIVSQTALLAAIW